MNKFLTLASAAAVALSMAAPVAADSVPLNNVAGGAGDESVTGQSLVLGALGAAGTAAVVVAVVVVATVALDDDDTAATTTN